MSATKVSTKRQGVRWSESISRYPLFYLMAIPGVVFFVMFYLIPSLGIVIAWQDFNLFKGVFHSPWVGWKHFERMFRYPEFLNIVSNTVAIGLWNLVAGFPVPIILALLLNEVNVRWYKRSVQTLIFMPHFLSWVIVAQIFYSILSPDAGFVNQILTNVFGIKPIFFMTKEALIQPLIAISNIWKESGYVSIVYLAALSAIDPQLYEAASIDGAGRWYQITRISLPLLIPTIVIMFLIQIGRFLEIGFDHVYNMINPLVWSKGEILNTYIYRMGLQQGKYSFTTAFEIFKSLIGFVLIFGGDRAAKKLTGRGFF